MWDPTDAYTVHVKRAAHESEMWQDRERLDYDWDPPRWYDRYSLRTRLLAALAAFGLLVAALGFGGGFRAQSAITTTDFRVPLVTGPYELRIQRAIFDKVQQKVVIEATCRLIDERQMVVSTEALRGGVQIALGRSHLVPFKDRSASFDVDQSSALSRDALSPDLPALPCLVSGKVPNGFQPPAHVHVAVMRQYYDRSDQVQKAGHDWRLGRGGTLVAVPLTVVEGAS